MFRRWFGLVLVLWGLFSAIVPAGPIGMGTADAATASCSWTDTTHIDCTDLVGSNATFTFSKFVGTDMQLTRKANCAGNYLLNVQPYKTATTAVFTDVCHGVDVPNIQLTNAYPSPSCAWQDTKTIVCQNLGSTGSKTYTEVKTSGTDMQLSYFNQCGADLLNVDPYQTATTAIWTNPCAHVDVPNIPLTNTWNDINGGTTGNDKPTCDAGSLTWLICPVISFIIDVVDNIRQDILVPFLHEAPLSTTTTVDGKAGQPNPVYQIWSAFRDAASVFFILVFFLIIFGTAIGFDNYTIKKVLPHLIAGAILLPFSWYLCAILIDVGNVLGQGLFSLADKFIPAPNIDFTSPLSQLLLGGVGVAGSLAAISLALSSAAEIGLGILLTILFAVLAALFTLVLRKILIILLVVLSPFAILAWILPNTQRLYKLWWQNFIRLVLMYPLIMLLFEAGRIFALTAGTLITTGGDIHFYDNLLFSIFTHNPLSAIVPFLAATSGQALAANNDFEKAAVPFLQLLGLFLPLGLIPWTFKWAGGAMALGANAIQRGRKGLDNRYGRNSEGAQQKKENRKMGYALKSDEAEKAAAAFRARGDHAAANAASARARMYRGMSGQGGFAGARGNALQQVKTQQAINDAHKTMGTVGALAAERRGEVPLESYEQRQRAEQQSAMNSMTDERAARGGLLQATGTTGAPPSLQTRYNAQSEMERRKQSVLAGEHESVVEADAHGGRQSSRSIASAALAVGLDDQSKIRGGTRGANQHEENLDELAIAAEAKRRGVTSITDPADRASIVARNRRLRFQTATGGAASKTVEEMGSHLADASGRLKDEHDEENEAVGAAAARAVRAGRTFTADDRAAVLSDVRRNRTGKIVGAGTETTRKAQAAATGEREAVLNDADTNPLTRAQLSQSAKDAQEGKLGIQAGVVRGNIQGTKDAMESAKKIALLQGRGRISDEEARRDVMRAGSGAYETLTKRQIQTAYGQNLSVADDERANPITADERISTARYNQAKAYGREAAGIRATSRTMKAEAQKAGIRNAQTDKAYRQAAKTSFDAGVVGQTKAMGEAVGAERAAVRTGKVKPISSATYIENSERQGERDLGAAAGATEKQLQAAQEAEQELVTAGATRDQARATLITRAADRKGLAQYIDTQDQYVDDRATLQGQQRAIINAMDDAKKAGKPLTRKQAEAQVFASMRSATERTSYNTQMGAYATARGVVEARAGQAQAAKEELVKDGRTLDTIKGEIAAKSGRAAGTISDAEADRQLDKEAGELVELSAHQKAVRDKRSEVVTSTGDEIGVKRGEDQMNEDEVRKIESEAAKAGKPKPSRADAYARARQRDVSNKVGTAIRDKQEAVVTEMGGDEGGISGEDKAMRQEMDMNPNDYAGYTAITDDMTPAQRAAAEAGNAKAVADSKNRDKARKTILKNVNREAERETRNARLGKASQAAGVKEGRRLRANAVRTELAERRGVPESAISGDEIESAIEGSSYRNKVTAKGEELRDSAADSVGTRFGREGELGEAAKRIQDDARKAGMVPPSDDVALEQARQDDATAQLRTKLHTAEKAAGGKIGTNRGNANIDAATIDAEQGTTLSNAHRFTGDVTIGASTTLATNAELAGDTKFPHEVTDVKGKVYAKGETVPSGTRLAVGTEVPTGVKLAAGTILKAGTRVQRDSAAAAEAKAAGKLISRQQARRAVVRKGVTSGQEQAERTRGQEQGVTAAYDRAANEGTPTPAERTATYEQAGLETIATETANVAAQSALAAEGRPMHRDFASMVKTRTDLAETKVLLDRIGEEDQEVLPYAGGSKRGQFELSVGPTGNVGKVIEHALQERQQGQTAKHIAGLRRAATSTEGSAEVIDRVRYKSTQQGGWGGSDVDSFDPSANPDLKLDTVVSQSMSNSKVPDATRPIVGAANNIKPVSFDSKSSNPLDNSVAQRMLDWFNYGAQEMEGTTQYQIERRDDPTPEFPDQRLMAEEALTRYQGTVDAKQWAEQGKVFVASLDTALDLDLQGRNAFDNKLLRTMANDAAYALQHEGEPGADQLAFNLTPEARKVRDRLLLRAERGGLKDWYREGVGADGKPKIHQRTLSHPTPATEAAVRRDALQPHAAMIAQLRASAAARVSSGELSDEEKQQVAAL